MAGNYKIYQSDFPYHIFNRTNNKEYLFDLKEDFPVFIWALDKVAQRTDFRPHHFILMQNHFHMIGSTPKANLFQFMHHFQLLVSKTINSKKGRINHIFGSRYHATVVDSEYYLSHLIRYLYQNPVKAGLCEDSLTYPYSSFGWYLNSNPNNGIFLYDPYLSNIKNEYRLEELKRLMTLPLHDKDNALIRKKLRKPVFNFDQNIA